MGERHRVVSVGDPRNQTRIVNLAALALDEVLPREWRTLPSGQHASVEFALAFTKLMAQEGYVLTRQVRP